MATKKRRSLTTSCPVSEQETVILISRDSKKARIYTCDSRYAIKLDKIYERTKEYTSGRKLTGIEYEVPESRISFRKGTMKLNLTDAERKERGKRLKEARNKKS